MARLQLPDVQRAAMDYNRGYSIGLPAVFGMAVMTPIMQLDSDRRRAVYAVTALLSCLPKGFGSSTLTIGGMLHAEEDRNGLKHLLLSAFRSSCLISGAATVVLLLFAPYIAMIYTAPPPRPIRWWFRAYGGTACP